MTVHKNNLSRCVYNIRSFAPTAEEFRQKIIEFFPNANIIYEINPSIYSHKLQLEDGSPVTITWYTDTDGRIHTTKAWRTNETFIHFVIAFFESERMLGKMYDEYRKKYNLKPTTNLIKTLTRGYSEAYLDSQKRKLIHQWSIPVDNPPALKK